MDRQLLIILVFLGVRNVSFICSAVSTETYEVPEQVANLSVSDVTSTSFILSWEPPSNADEYQIEEYSIYIKFLNIMIDDTCVIGKCLETNDTTNETSYAFENGMPYSNYIVTVHAESNNGHGKPTSITVDTKEGLPDAPTELKVEESNDILMLTWQPPICSWGNLTFYHIYVNCVKSWDGPNCPCPEGSYRNFTVPSSQTILNVTEVKPYSWYKIAISADTREGTGNKSYITYSTEEGFPDQPYKLSVTPDFIVKWEKPLCTNGILLTYYLNIYFMGRNNITEDCPSEDNQTYSYWVNAALTEFKFMESQAYSLYYVELFAATAAGNGTNRTSRFQSLPAVLGEVQSLEVESLDSKTASITWKTPCPITDEISAFSIHINGYRPNFENDTKIFDLEPQLFCKDASDLKPEYKYALTLAAHGRNTGTGSNANTSFQQPAGIPTLKNISLELMANTEDTSDPTRQACISVPVSMFDPTNGDILYYAIFVAHYSFGQNSIRGQLESPIISKNCNDTWPNASYWSDVTKDDVQNGEYQATPDCWHPNTTEELFVFVLGTDKPCGPPQYCNGPLHPHTEYSYKVRAFTSHGFQDTDVVFFHTDSEVAVGLALGFVFGFLIAGALLFGFVMYRKGQISCSLASIISDNDTRDVRPRPIPLKNFSKHCELLLDIHGRVSSEFQLLATLCVDINDANTVTVGQLPDNKRKNRYVNILPFDTNRVKLDIVDDDPSSDYINASFIKGNSKSIEYIATQGPKEETVKDFWRMVHQCGVSIIIMLTQLEEQGKVKCHQYYPNLRETVKYGDIVVRCTTELQFSFYTSRTIILLKGDERRTIVHLFFQEWPDFGCPTTTGVMLQFCQTVRHQILLSNMGLTLVHCSAGVGRTGTLIALDVLLQHVRENKSVDIFGLVYELRKQRAYMVQAETQYAYIYRCVRDVLEDPSNTKHDKTSTSSLEPIYENAGPDLNSAALTNSRRIKTKSSFFGSEYEL